MLIMVQQQHCYLLKLQELVGGSTIFPFLKTQKYFVIFEINR